MMDIFVLMTQEDFESDATHKTNNVLHKIIPLLLLSYIA